MFKKTSVLLAAALAAPLMTTSAFAIDVVTNGDFEHRNVVDNGNDVNINTANGWLHWAHTVNGSPFARIWNPGTVDRQAIAGNSFYDSSWGGLDASGNADGEVIAIHTMGWDYRNSQSFNFAYDPFTNTYSNTTDVSNIWTTDAGNRIWSGTDGGTGAGGTVYSWRFDDGGTPSGGTGTAGDPYVFDLEGDKASGWNGTATRDFEAVAQVVGAFDPTAKYTLTVAVGRLAAEGFNAGRVDSNNNGILNEFNVGPDTIAGTADDTPIDQNSTRHQNDVDALWGGYMVDLFAGGDGASNWRYGIEGGDMTAIDSDDNTEAIAENTWGTSTLSYTPGTGPNLSALAGQDLVIRLAAKELADHQKVTAAAFDNVVLTKIIAGDANENDVVDFTDLNVVLGNYNGATTGQNWNTGDFTGNGDVEFNDLNLLLGNYNQVASVATSENIALSVEAALATGEVQLIVNADGSLTLEGDTANILSYQILSASGLLIPDADGNPNEAGAFVFYAANTTFEVAAASFGLVPIDGLVDIDAAINPLNLESLDLTFAYGIAGGATIQGEVVVIPEPSSLALLGLGGLAMMRRRRNA